MPRTVGQFNPELIVNLYKTQERRADEMVGPPFSFLIQPGLKKLVSNNATQSGKLPE